MIAYVEDLSCRACKKSQINLMLSILCLIKVDFRVLELTQRQDCWPRVSKNA